MQLEPAEVTALQQGTQKAWTAALNLLLKKQKYISQAFRGLPAGPNGVDAAACASWMRTQCARPANESAVIYGTASPTNMSAANLSIAAFLVTRGAHSYQSADKPTVEGRDASSPLYRLLQLDVGTPLAGCAESPSGVFSRKWSGGLATVDCSGTPTATLAFRKSLLG